MRMKMVCDDRTLREVANAYCGSTTFNRKKKMLPKDIIEFKEAYGICKFKMTL